MISLLTSFHTRRIPNVHWRVRAIRGAITVTENTKDAIAEAVTELLDELESRNPLDLSEVVSVTFSVTRDLDAIFPAAIARKRPGWDQVPLMDFQHMYVAGSLERCIRLLLHFNTPDPAQKIYHPYLRDARILRPDLALVTPFVQS
nr:chorismate mutase [Alkalinema sp. FACHB-956]